MLRNTPSMPFFPPGRVPQCFPVHHANGNSAQSRIILTHISRSLPQKHLWPVVSQAPSLASFILRAQLRLITLTREEYGSWSSLFLSTTQVLITLIARLIHTSLGSISLSRSYLFLVPTSFSSLPLSHPYLFLIPTSFSSLSLSHPYLFSPLPLSRSYLSLILTSLSHPLPLSFSSLPPSFSSLPLSLIHTSFPSLPFSLISRN
jgi:hypothetical protein